MKQWPQSYHYQYDQQGNMIYYLGKFDHENHVMRAYSYDRHGNWIRAASNNWYDSEHPDPATPLVIIRQIEYYE